MQLSHGITPTYSTNGFESTGKQNSIKDQVSRSVTTFTQACDDPEKLELAFLYDVCYTHEFHGNQDVDFYVKESEKLGNDIFELGIGTGRIGIELLKKGKKLDAIDLSPGRLTVLNDKLKKLPTTLQDNIRVYCENILNFKIDKKYDAIFLSFRVLQEFSSLQDRIQLLAWAKDHLNNQGKIILDVFYPDLKLLISYLKEEKHFLSVSNPNEKYSLIERHYYKNNLDTKEQNFSGFWIHKLFLNNSSEKRIEEPFKMHYYTYNELILLFKLCQLEVSEEFGSFDKTLPIGEGPEMIFILTPSPPPLLANAQKV